jgi:hypothetical protein
LNALSVSPRKIYLQELGLHVLAGHEIEQLQVEILANGGSGHLNGTAWSGTLEGEKRASEQHST